MVVMASYGSMPYHPDVLAPVKMAPRRLIPGLAAAALIFGTVALVAVGISESNQNDFVELGETSVRTDVVHPYETMHLANKKFVNPNQIRDRPVKRW